MVLRRVDEQTVGVALKAMGNMADPEFMEALAT